MASEPPLPAHAQVLSRGGRGSKTTGDCGKLILGNKPNEQTEELKGGTTCANIRWIRRMKWHGRSFQ